MKNQLGRSIVNVNAYMIEFDAPPCKVFLPKSEHAHEAGEQEIRTCSHPHYYTLLLSAYLSKCI